MNQFRFKMGEKIVEASLMKKCLKKRLNGVIYTIIHISASVGD